MWEPRTDLDGVPPRRRPATAMTRARLLRMLDQAFRAGSWLRYDNPEVTVKAFEAELEIACERIAGDFGKGGV